MEAARAIAKGWGKQRPADVLRLLPMSDGGDGFGEVLGLSLGASQQRVRAVDAAHRRCLVKWWWEPESRTAVIESAEVIGLAMLPAGKYHPFELDTFGLGSVIRAAVSKGAKRMLVGIGGSATNDGGFGLARSLRWRFLDGSGEPVVEWTRLTSLERVMPPERSFKIPSLVVAVDVQNTLLGPKGATRVYGPQKGLRKSDFKQAEACLRQLARITARTTKLDYAKQAGSGAAGGLGFGLAAFLGARFEPGFDLFSRYADLRRQLAWADLVITGEGAIDESTLMGKGVGEIARRCRQRKIPCIGLAGVVAPKARQNGLFAEAHALTDLTASDAARARAGFWLEKLASHCSAFWNGER